MLVLVLVLGRVVDCWGLKEGLECLGLPNAERRAGQSPRRITRDVAVIQALLRNSGLIYTPCVRFSARPARSCEYICKMSKVVSAQVGW